MFPYILRLNSIAIPSYPFLFGLGITVAGIVMLILGKKEGYSYRQTGNMFILLALSILFGGRLFYVLEYYYEYSGDWIEIFNMTEGGQVFYGGLALAVITQVLYCKNTQIKIGIALDFTITGATLGLAIGRMGCFCKGCCYGKITDISWAVHFPKHLDMSGNIVGSPAFLRHVNEGLVSPLSSCSFAVHPTQLYSAIFAFCFFVFLLYLWKSKYARGKLLLMFMTIYSVFRFNIEWIRENEVRFVGLTSAQCISVAIYVACLVVWFIYHFQKTPAILSRRRKAK